MALQDSVFANALHFDVQEHNDERLSIYEYLFSSSFHMPSFNKLDEIENQSLFFHFARFSTFIMRDTLGLIIFFFKLGDDILNVEKYLF